MMDIRTVSDIIGRIASGFEEACIRCMDDNRHIVVSMVREQLYSGQDGEGRLLNPTYDNDPFFNEEGFWHGRSQDYKAWKYKVTPPQQNAVFPLGLSPRPSDVPNLFINGQFYSEISATRQGNMLVTNPGMGNGPSIVAKYGDSILDIGPTAKEYFNIHYMIPAIADFFKNCGYR